MHEGVWLPRPIKKITEGLIKTVPENTTTVISLGRAGIDGVVHTGEDPTEAVACVPSGVNWHKAEKKKVAVSDKDNTATQHQHLNISPPSFVSKPSTTPLKENF